MFPGVSPLLEDAGPGRTVLVDLHHVTGVLGALGAALDLTAVC